LGEFAVKLLVLGKPLSVPGIKLLVSVPGIPL